MYSSWSYFLRIIEFPSEIFKALSSQTSMHLEQLVHSDEEIIPDLMFIIFNTWCSGHTSKHLPQSVHFSESWRILIRANFPIKAYEAPIGHRCPHQPFRNKARSNRKTTAIIAHPPPIPKMIPRWSVDTGLIASNAGVERIKDKMIPSINIPYRMFLGSI